VSSLGGPALAGNEDRLFPVVGQCGIPLSAKALALNVTVIQASLPGDLRIYPGGTAIPLASAINYRGGETRANNASARLGIGGRLGVHCDQSSGTVNVVIDVNGYFQ